MAASFRSCRLPANAEELNLYEWVGTGTHRDRRATSLGEDRQICGTSSWTEGVPRRTSQLRRRDSMVDLKREANREPRSSTWIGRRHEAGTRPGPATTCCCSQEAYIRRERSGRNDLPPSFAECTEPGRTAGKESEEVWLRAVERFMSRFMRLDSEAQRLEAVEHAMLEEQRSTVARNRAARSFIKYPPRRCRSCCSTMLARPRPPQPVAAPQGHPA